MKRIQWMVALMVLFGTLFATFSYYLYQTFLTPNILVKAQEERAIVIPEGADFHQVMDTLDKYEVLTDRLSFAFLSKLSGYKENIRPGHYVLKPNMTNKEAIWKLRAGNQNPVKIRFTSTRSLERIAHLLCRPIQAKPDSFLVLLQDKAFLDKYGFTPSTVYAMLLPNTYELYWNTDALGLFKRLYSEHQTWWNEERQAKAKQLGMNTLEVSTLASIVYEETKKIDEMPRVAGVYINRLKNPNATDGLLQADPTVKFAVGDPTMKRIYQKHTQIDHPYNTYKYPGLPPGPINVPSLQALDAVLNYEKHDFYYFCARPDYSGYHVFARNLPEHNRNAAAYRRFLNKEGIH